MIAQLVFSRSPSNSLNLSHTSLSLSHGDVCACIYVCVCACILNGYRDVMMGDGASIKSQVAYLGDFSFFLIFTVG